MSDKKKPGVAFWATVVVVALVLYVASFWPACWLTSRQILAPALTASTYYPIVWASARGPRPIRDAIGAYGELGASRTCSVVYLQIELKLLARLDD